jgi:hypothetical protein
MSRALCVSVVLYLTVSLGISQQVDNPKVPNPPTTAIPDGEAHFTAEQLDKYYLVYNNPDVRYLRTLFDEYLRGESGKEDEFNLLKAWSSDYYKSKFIVLSRDRNPFGGTLITIIFQDRPDKIFVSWVYSEGAEKGLKLRVLDPSKYSDEDVKQTRTRYRMFFEDKVHAM